jgi:hypothetical protein
MVSFIQEHGRRIRRICGGKLSGWGKEKIEYLSPLREIHFLV